MKLHSCRFVQIIFRAIFNTLLQYLVFFSVVRCRMWELLFVVVAFRAPEPLPILNASSFVPKNRVSSCKGVSFRQKSRVCGHTQVLEP